MPPSAPALRLLQEGRLAGGEAAGAGPRPCVPAAVIGVFLSAGPWGDAAGVQGGPALHQELCWHLSHHLPKGKGGAFLALQVPRAGLDGKCECPCSALGGRECHSLLSCAHGQSVCLLLQRHPSKSSAQSIRIF